ncbi:NAD-dependent epimerase/dehydratase family protein [Streptomyces violascens]|uniref:NAD-dependent epimerase/dehydratase family protein n=1 Tax=Streptomyces violascens TaxID=67381 RepID=UPI0036C4F5EE
MTPSATYLVTGGAGFIGSHLTDALLGQGHAVVVLDDLSTGSRQNLGGPPSPRLQFVRGSVLDKRLVEELISRCDVVVHLAAAVGVRLIVEQPLESFRTNVRGTENVIEAAQRHGRRVIVASSSEIYGKNGSGPLHESADRVLGAIAVARWWYSTAKAVDEILALGYHREYGLAATVVRFFNTVGPRQSPSYGMVVPRLVRQAVTGQPLTVYEDGTQRRCFTHVADAVEALLALIEHPGSVGEVFNIGGSEETSITELAERILARAGSSSPLTYIPYTQAYGSGFSNFEDMERRLPDTTRLRELTGWRPARTLDDILDETIAQARAETQVAQSGRGRPTVPSPGPRTPAIVPPPSSPDLG